MPKLFHVDKAAAGHRLDQFLVAQLAEVSRARVQELIAQEKVSVEGAPAKASRKLRAGEKVEITGEAVRPPLKAVAEDIPLDVVFEDKYLAVINKPAGMMVHAGAAKADAVSNRGTLVNALLHRFGKLSQGGGHALRPGIVHRLDKETSGLIIVAKDDVTHRKLQEQFASRHVKKKYIALVHGWPKLAHATIDRPIARDQNRRIRMTTRTRAGRAAVSHYKVLRRIDSPFGQLALVEVKIDTGRTHQVRVHMASLAHPVAGDALYGAPAKLKSGKQGALSLGRNFLHAAELEFTHPSTGRTMHFRAPLPPELRDFLRRLGETELPDGI
ncbi:MAG: RluA family pseudouridine synthase [Candidatus Koribacter versatilis]|uniref:Pseudouridine synthase n=1 Tax=Candidatus Korobacter versatilis TaxID=658062 RepID=A0A932ABP6_9BACT|nr:RluA family pseudouridine synthase [Candidatus Koribacter versatilis]